MDKVAGPPTCACEVSGCVLHFAAKEMWWRLESMTRLLEKIAEYGEPTNPFDTEAKPEPGRPAWDVRLAASAGSEAFKARLLFEKIAGAEAAITKATGGRDGQV